MTSDVVEEGYEAEHVGVDQTTSANSTVGLITSVHEKNVEEAVEHMVFRPRVAILPFVAADKEKSREGSD